MIGFEIGIARILQKKSRKNLKMHEKYKFLLTFQSYLFPLKNSKTLNDGAQQNLKIPIW